MMTRYVILEHTHPFLHWDLMLDVGESLQTWRLLVEPNSTTVLPAEPLPNHRKTYLDYEGPVSGNRGRVIRWDQGEYELIRDEPDGVEVRLSGEKLSGVVQLVMSTSEGADDC